MDIKDVQNELRRGVAPSPDYPNLPNDFTAEELIAYDPKAELEYRLAKDRHPGMTRAKIMQHWRAFRIGRIFEPEDGRPAGGDGLSILEKAVRRLKRRDR